MGFLKSILHSTPYLLQTDSASPFSSTSQCQCHLPFAQTILPYFLLSIIIYLLQVPSLPNASLWYDPISQQHAIQQTKPYMTRRHCLISNLSISSCTKGIDLDISVSAEYINRTRESSGGSETTPEFNLFELETQFLDQHRLYLLINMRFLCWSLPEKDFIITAAIL